MPGVLADVIQETAIRTSTYFSRQEKISTAMPQTRIKPCAIHPALRSLIRNIVIIDADFGKNSVSIEGNYMPSPDQAMFINLHTRLKSRKSGENKLKTVTSCTLIGPQITPFKLAVSESHKTVSIIFQPGGLNRFLNIPMTELFDNGYSAREVIGREIEAFLDQAHDTMNLDDLNDIVQAYFLKKIPKVKEPSPIDFALQHLLANYNTNIDQIAAMACMSLRTFERKCHERLGMTAKMYARIARFHKAYKILEDRSNASWSELAYGAGYYDQMHFIKDFKEFARGTPSVVQKELGEGQMRFQIDWDSL